MTDEQRPYAGGSVPETYERCLVPLLFLDYGADLAAQVAVPEGGVALETACGTGAVTRHLAPRLPEDSALVATDLAPPMVEITRRVLGDTPNVTVEQADAMDLPFDNDSFDVMACQFSLMLLSDKQEAFNEAARVLKTGGSFVFNIWDRLEENMFSAAVHDAVGDIFPDDPPEFLQVPYSWHDLTTAVRTAQEAGFQQIDIAVQPRVSRAVDARQVATGLVAGSPLANQVTERGSPSLEATVEAVTERLQSSFGDGPISAPMQAFRLVATLPG